MIRAPGRTQALGYRSYIWRSSLEGWLRLIRRCAPPQGGCTLDIGRGTEGKGGGW